VTHPLIRQQKASVLKLLPYAVLLVFLIGSLGCERGHPQPPFEASGSEAHKSIAIRILRRGLPGEPRTLDPQKADDTYSFQVVRDLYEGLTAVDRRGDIIPGAASSWAVDKTGTIYTFRLRPDAQWSDGERIQPQEFVLGLRRAVDPKTASGSATLLTVIRGASDIIAGRTSPAELSVFAIDESTVRVELEYPAPFVLQVLAEPIAMPFHIATNTGATGASLISNGPYTLANRVQGSFIELVKNPNYWNASDVTIERVRYVDEESESTELRAYTAGQLELTNTVPIPDLKRVESVYGAELQTASILGTLYLALNLTENPLRDSRDLRQALSMAVDREFIAEHETVGVTPAYSFVARGVSGYEPPIYSWADWTRERRLRFAKNLYARAGYSKEHPLQLKVYFNSGESIHRIMIAVAGSWKQNLGVECALIADEFRVFLDGRKDRSRWDVARLGWWADYDDPSSFLEVFARNNNQNDPAYASLEFNHLIDAARVEPEAERRMLLLHRAEDVLLNDYPIIPIYFYTARRLVKLDVGGAEISPLNRTYSRHLFWK
jgi:oligopeptide transport system substrate-binding protein